MKQLVGWLRFPLAALLLACAAGTGAEPAPTTSLPAADGPDLTLFAADDERITVVIFISPDCPVSNGYAPTVHRLSERYAERPVRIVLVHPDPDVTAGRARDHAADYRYTCEVALDPEQRLVRQVEATVTPEAAVFGADHRLVYLGRIDNRWEDYGVQRDEPTTHELRDAIDAALAGEAPPIDRCTAVGCPIPPRD